MYENYKGIDIGKLIAAFLIVLLHSTETGHYVTRGIMFTLTGFAVPFFFITSGWFLSKAFEDKTQHEQKKYTRRFTIKLLYLYTIWALIIYLPFTTYEYFHLPKYNDAETWYIILVLLRKLFIVGSGPYWFILALIGGCLWCYLARNTPKIMTTIMLLTFLLMILYVNFRNVTDDFFLLKHFYWSIDMLYSWEFNFLTYSIPFCSLGFLIRKGQIKLSPITAILGFILFTSCRIVEYSLSGQLSLAFIPQSFCYFFMMLNYTPNNISEQASRRIRSMSSFIYFSHAIILWNLLNPCLKYFDFPYIYAPEAILLKAILVTTVCCILFFIIDKRKNRITKILLNS